MPPNRRSAGEQWWRVILGSGSGSTAVEVTATDSVSALLTGINTALSRCIITEWQLLRNVRDLTIRVKRIKRSAYADPR